MLRGDLTTPMNELKALVTPLPCKYAHFIDVQECSLKHHV